MEKLEKDLMNFIDKTPNAYVCTENIKKLLLNNGFIQLYENEDWNNVSKGKNYFVIRNDSSLIAFKMPKDINNVGFNIVATHGDSPSFTVKPNADIFDNEYLKLNVNGYGGVLNYSWLDRPLSLAGRIITLTDEVYEKQIINIDKDLLVIPSQAYHLNKNANTKNELNQQKDLLPIMALNNEMKLDDIIKEYLNNPQIDKICDYDLYLYNRDKSKYIGLNNEFILAPRLDDLACLYLAYQSFIESNNNNSTINIYGVFNNEEVGNLTQQGADSSFLTDILNRIAKVLNINLAVALKNSFIVSADNAHAIHPNAKEKNDPTNKVQLNNGVVIKYHINFTTDGLTASLFKGICDKANIPYQDFASRSDMDCGSTLGGISQSHVSIDSVDIGIAQLAMHSSAETIGREDIKYMYKALLEFYNTKIIKDKDIVKFS